MHKKDEAEEVSLQEEVGVSDFCVVPGDGSFSL
jgi:hypothetical protein